MNKFDAEFLSCSSNWASVGLDWELEVPKDDIFAEPERAKAEIISFWLKRHNSQLSMIHIVGGLLEHEPGCYNPVRGQEDLINKNMILLENLFVV